MNCRNIIARTVRSLLPLVPFLVAATAARSQTLPASAGTDFHALLPSLGIAENAELRLVITAVASTQVTVTFLDVDSSIANFVETGTSWTIVIPRGRIEVIGQQETRSDRGLRIVSEEPVTVQAYHDADFFAEGWIVFPTIALGFDHRIVSFGSDNDLNLNGGVAAAAATADNTTLRITPTVATGSGNSPGFTYGIDLDAGEIWQVVPRRPERTDMSGTRLEADRPIAVVAGHRGTDLVPGIGATNPMIESMPPINQWGKEFHAIPPPARDTGYYKIVAARNGTLIRVNGADIATLNAGETVRYAAAGPVGFTSSHPVLIAEFTQHRVSDTTGMNADPSMTLLQPAGAWTNSYLWTTPSLRLRPWPGPTDPERFLPFTHFLQVTAPVGPNNQVLLDGVDITPSLTTFHPDGIHRSGIVRIDTGTHRLECAVPVAAQLVGYNHFDAYFLPAGYRIPPVIEVSPVIGSTCDSIFHAQVPVRTGRAQPVRIQEVTFIGIDGTIPSPAFPMDLLPFFERTLLVNFGPLDFGTNVGVMRFRFAGDSLADFDVPVTIVRDRLEIRIPEDELEFPDATLANPVRDSTLAVVNTGTAPISIEDIRVAPPFEIVEADLPAELSPGDTLRIRVRFAPSTPGDYAQEIRISTGPCDVPAAATLRGRRTDPAVIDIRISDEPTILCPEETPGKIVVFVYNRGGEPITIGGIDVEGDDRNDFTPAMDPAGRPIPPGDSLAIPLDFQPTDTGMRTATVRIRHDLPPGFTLVEVSARKDSAGFAFAEQFIEFGDRVTCLVPGVNTVFLRNTGTVPVTIGSLSLSTGTAFLTTTSPGRTIPPGDSIAIDLGFVPPGSGVWNDTLLVSGSPCSLQARIPLRGTGLTPDLSVEPDTLDFGDRAFCMIPDTLTARLRNTGDVPDTISSVQILGAAFRHIGTSADPVLPGEESLLAIVFEPSGDGTFVAEMIVRTEPCGFERRIVLKGASRAVSLEVTAVDLGMVPPGSTAEGGSTLRNTGELPITIDSIPLDEAPEGLRHISPALPITIPPGDSVSLVFQYESNLPDGFQSTVVLHASPCSIEVPVIIRADRGPGDMMLVLPDTSADVDAIVAIPILLTGGEELEQEVRLIVEVRWDLTNLLPKGLIDGNDGTMTPLADSIAGRQRMVRFLYEGGIPEDGVLGFIEARVLLGDDDTTLLDGTVVESVLAESGAGLDVGVRDGSFRTLGICVIDGGRFVRIDGGLQRGRLRPNPATETAIIPFTSAERGTADLAIYDRHGTGVLVQSAISVKSGTNELAVDLSRLPSGLYLYRLRVGIDEIRDLFIVVR